MKKYLSLKKTNEMNVDDIANKKIKTEQTSLHFADTLVFIASLLRNNRKESSK